MTHGGNIYKYAKDLDCKPQDIIDFSSNINAYIPDITLNPTQEMIVPYAESSYDELRSAIKIKYNVKKSQIALFNGASSAIFTLINQLKPKAVTLYAPLYSEYQNACRDKDIYKINRTDDVYTKPEKGSIVVFVNPSTPEGTYYDLQALFKIWKKQKCTVIIDESFLAFEALKSCRDMLTLFKKLYIVQSFTKYYSCAGVRVAAVFASKKNVEKLHIPAWNISSFDAVFMTNRLKDTGFDARSRKQHEENKKELFELLNTYDFIHEVYESESNFFMLHVPRATELFEYLLSYKILVRTCESFDYLDETYIRFAVKSKIDHAKLKEALDAFS